MNSPKLVVALGLTLIFSMLLTGCGGKSSTKPIPGSPTIQTVLLPQGAVNVAYGVNGMGAILSATGGTGSYTWSITAGSLPPGLTLNATTGVISGTPTQAACTGTGGGSTNPCNYTFTVQVTDSVGLAYAKPLSIYIAGVVSITQAALPTGTPMVPYTNADGSPVQLMATGGLTPYTWCAIESDGTTCDTGTGGTLPPGLSLSTSGVISGTPTTPGLPTTFSARVMDSETAPGVPAIGTAQFTITVMSVSTTSLPSGYLNIAYSGGVTVVGGLIPYTWTITSGMLPPGLSLDPATCTASKTPTCKITGTPTQVGAYPVTFKVNDKVSDGAVATASLTLNVFQSQMTITTTSLPLGIVGIAYSAPLVATGGIPPYKWCVFEKDGSCDNGALVLPPGLTLDAGTGVISGTPTTTGTSSFTVQATDSESPQQMASSGTLAIAVSPGVGNANLKGNYVFTFNGYKNSGPVMMAGSFVADGSGNITSGVLDYNDGTGEPVDSHNNPIPQTIGAGSVYNITPNGLGTMTLTTNVSVFQFAVVIKSDGSGRLIQSDPANKQAYGSGPILINTPLAEGETFPLCGSHMALGFFGYDNTLLTRYAGAGEFQFDPTTCVDAENGVMDTNDGGTVSSPTFTGAFNQLIPSTSRGITGLTLSPGGRHFYAFYLVSTADRKTNRLFWVATEPASQPAALTLWSGFQQASSALFGFNNWNNLALTGTGVTELNALDTNGAVDVTAGLFKGQGASAHTCTSGSNGMPQYDPATFNYDENQGGTSSLQQTSMGTYCVDKPTGRVTITGFTGQFGAFPPVFYMVGGNQAFVVGTDPAVTSGYMELQTGSPFTNGSASGPYIGGTTQPITSAVTNAVSWLFADGADNINGTGNTSGPAGPGQQNFTYTYAVDSTGRAVLQNGGSTVGVLYVVSPQKFVMLPTVDPNPALSVFNQ